MEHRETGTARSVPSAADVRARVVVAVLTYRRPEDLAAVLPLLVRQAQMCADSVEVLVVDNDPDAGARRTVSAFPGPVRYVHEPTPGIAAARNRALDAAGPADVLVFVDDDERPSERWLPLLLEHWKDSGATAVVGPVVSEYDGTMSDWVRAGEFFRRRRLPTGTAITVAATNNLLLDLAWVNRHRLRFDQQFGLAGGEDTLFTRRIISLGGSMEWNDEAIVLDRVPAERLSARWVLQRAFSSGNAWSRVALHLTRTPAEAWWTRIVLTGRGVPRLVVGLLRTALGLVTRRAGHQAKGLRTAARGAGMLSGACGYVYSEYRRRSG